MFKIYAKIITDNKVISDHVYELTREFAITDFFEYIQDISIFLVKKK